MAWLQLKIPTTPANAAQIEDALLACGALSITFTDNADQPILEPALGETPLWRDTGITALFNAEVDTAAINSRLEQGIDDFANKHHWEIVEDKDWEREWMRHYHPIDCGHGLWICPSWQQPPEPDAVNILLDPGLAFGTGTHPTTLLCLQWLASQTVKDLTVIDYGCGSGILGIAALKLGARQVIAVDIDPQALLATRDNAERNNIEPTAIETFFPDQAPNRTGAIVFANILAGPLVELAPRLLSSTSAGGLLCLSGILDSQAESVLAAYQPQCQVQSRQVKDHWLQLTLRKP